MAIEFKKEANLNYYDNDDNDNVLNEILSSLNIEKNEEKNVKINKRKSIDAKVEYEIIMNCDDSDYIVYYKK